MERAGYEIKGEERSYKPRINDSEILLKILRPQEIPIFVAEGSYDLGITGLDWVFETNADVEILAYLGYGKVRLVFAAPKWWSIDSLDELIRKYYKDGKDLRVATEYLNLASKYLVNSTEYKRFFGNKPPTIITPWWVKKGNSRVRIFLSFGATEAKPPEDADVIFDNSATGISLYQNNLKVIASTMYSEAVLIACKKSLKEREKREKILDVKTLLQGVVEAQAKLHIFLNVKEENLPKLLEKLPALKGPTIAPLSIKGWYSVNTVVDKNEFFKLIAVIRRLAQGLVVYEPKQVLLLEGEQL